MTASRQRIMYGAGNGEDFAPLFSGKSRTEHRAAAIRSFDDERTQAQPADQSIPAWKMVASRWCTKGKLRTQGAARDDSRGEVSVSGRVNAVDTMAEKCNRHCAAMQGAFVSSSIDAFGEAADDTETGGAELMCEACGIVYAAARRIATAHDGDRRQVQRADIAVNIELAWRVRNSRQHMRVIGIAEMQDVAIRQAQPSPIWRRIASCLHHVAALLQCI